MKLNKEELYAAMKIHNYNISTLAKEMGVSRSTMHKVLNDEREPGNKFLEGLKKVFTREETLNILEI